MNITKNIFFSAAVAAFIATLNACGGGGGGVSGNGGDSLVGYLETKDIQSDLGNLAEFAYYTEYIKVAPIAFMASSKGLFTDNVDSSEAGEFFGVLTKMSEKADEYESALSRIDSKQAFMSETPAALQKVGLIYAMRDFFRSLRGCGKATREKAMAVAGELKDKNQLKILFDGLDANQKRGETDYLSWWKKFNNGDYDDASLQIYNRMYYNTESSFADEAEFINKTVAKTGVELSEKAAAFEVEILKTALPDAVTDAMGKIETAEKINTIITQGKDMSADELKDKVLDVFIEDYDDVKKASEMLGEDVEAISNLTKKILDDNSSLTDAASSTVTFTDKGETALKDGKMTVAISNETGKVTIALGVNDKGDHEIVLKEGGEHVVSFVDESGKKFTQSVDAKPGKDIKLEGKLNEKEIRESQVKSSSSKKYGRSSSSKAVVKSSSSVAKGGKFPNDVRGKWTVTTELYIHKITNKKMCTEIWGGSSEECVDSEVEDDYCVGQSMNVYSDGSIDYIARNGSTDSFSYSYNSKNGTFTYSDASGNKYTAQVATDGITMTMETVTDASYMTITHRLIFKKVSNKVED